MEGLGLTYKAAGVDIEAGSELVRRIKRLARETYDQGVVEGVGAFGAPYSLAWLGLRDPVLVSGADGVGTKLKVAFLAGRHDTVGIDVVAYCVNDIICHGARPLFFLDYLAFGKLDVDVAEQVVKGVAAGCREAGCALVGGETAEMPGFYATGEYDLAGFAVGAVQRTDYLDGSRVMPGDVLVGLASTGLHSTGYSLVRKAVFEKAGLSVDAVVDELGSGTTVAEELLRPTAVYAADVLAVLYGPNRCEVHGIANISGGGIPENLPRSLRPGTVARIEVGTWDIPPVFGWVEKLGDVQPDDMWRTFNMGLGMILVVAARDANRAVAILTGRGRRARVVGEIEPAPPARAQGSGVRLVGRYRGKPLSGDLLEHGK